MEDIEPLVSICCITYNHEKFIRDTIEGFLIQKTSFPIEIIIHDDASTDNTPSIIKEYSEKYPDLFETILQTENQWSKSGGSIYSKFVFPRARGRYIALCEGDDYWTDPLKLRKQVDYMENNNNIHLCVGGFKEINMYSGETENVIRMPNNIKLSKDGYCFTLDDIRKSWLTKSLTVLFINNKELIDNLNAYKYGRDINLIYHILKTGQGFYFTQVFGVYRIHEGGVNSMKHGKINITNSYNVYKELFQINKDKFTQHMYVISGINYIGYNLLRKNDTLNSKVKFNILIGVLKNVTSIREIIILIKVVLIDNFNLFVLRKKK